MIMTLKKDKRLHPHENVHHNALKINQFLLSVIAL